MCKCDTWQHMVSNRMDIVDLTPVQKEKAREALADHASCARPVAKHPAFSNEPDLSWQVNTTRSHVQLADADVTDGPARRSASELKNSVLHVLCHWPGPGEKETRILWGRKGDEGISGTCKFR